jgi:serine/threonine-protein kinase
MRCLEKSPEDRPRTAEDILRALGSASLTASAATDRRPSVAVLPMVNLSGAEENDHFSDGLTDELIGALGQVAELTVSGRTSVFALRGKDLGVRAIADTLNVAHVLEGSVRRAGHRLKVRVQLVDADGKILWSEAYDRTLTDVFAVQEEIAQAVVRALEIRLGTARGPLVRPPTTDLTAYDLYLKGRYVRRRFNADDLSRAIGYFEQAVALDPAYARAHAALSDAHTLLAVFGGRPALQQLPVARTYAQRAVELDGMLADAHWALAHVSFALELDLPAAGREFRRALELDPGHGDARHMYAIWLLDFRRFEEAAGETTRALAADPLLAEASMTLGRVYTAMGRADRAIPYLLDALELSPGFTYAREQLAHAYLQLGRHDAAVAECERAASAGGGREAAVLAYTYAVAGRTPEASAMVRELTSGDGYAPPCHVAMAFAGLGDSDAALAWLERAFAEHDPHLTGLAILPAFEPLRADPRFATLVSRLGVEP